MCSRVTVMGDPEGNGTDHASIVSDLDGEQELFC